MSTPRFIALIGYRGTGKSTVTRKLATRLGWEAIDADVELERRAGKSIKTIFADEGEPAFRDLEAAVLRDLVSRERIVLALGGGVILREENRQALMSGFVVWLQADATTILARTAADPTTVDRRPNLTTSGGLAEIEQLLAVREPRYRSCANQIVDTMGKSPQQIADEVVLG